MRATLTVSSKGQITLKKALLAHLGVRPGDRVVVRAKADGALELAPAPTGEIAAVFGMLKRPGQRRVPLEEMNAAIADAWSAKR